ncbi:MAG: hypothetical protein PHO92_01990 [Candidatus Peribacteraceae bacterium]|nr:hypothetical protein [Candidatus Peribacteraceae bacterium]
MKHFVLSIFALSLFFGNFCPMRAVHAQAVEMPAASHGHMAHAANHAPCDEEEPSQTFQSAPCTGSACFLGEYIADQRSSSHSRHAEEPVAFAGITLAGTLMDVPMASPASVMPPGRHSNSLGHIATVVLRT